MTTLSPPLPPLLTDGAFLIDNSTFEWLLTCDRGAEYKIVHKRELAGGVSSLNFGGAIHAALDVRYRSPLDFAIDSLDAQVAAAEAYLREHPTEFGDWRDLPLATQVIRDYCLTYQVEDFALWPGPNSAPVVELPFAVPLGEVDCGFAIDGTVRDVVPIIWTGKIDLPITLRSGERWFMDHKTTSVLGPTYFDQYYLSTQMIGYAWALERLAGTRIHGALINAIGIRKPTKSGRGIEFVRQHIRYDPHLIDEWHHNTMTLLGEFFARLRDNFFPKKTMWCMTKWNRRCPYWDVCTLPPESRLTMLNSNIYKPVTWSPLS